MSNLYSKIAELCESNGINITAMCKLSNIPRSNLSELKQGNVKTLSVPTLRKIADYFEVTFEYLLSNQTSSEMEVEPMSTDKLIFTVPKPQPKREPADKERVRISAAALQCIEEVQVATRLSAKEVASRMILFAADYVEIEEE